MKNRIYSILLALVLCIGAFLLPTEAFAQEMQEAGSTADSSDIREVTENGWGSFTPDGQAAVMDHVTDEDGKEFYTFYTPEGSVFYLVIDRQRETDNVYFLNAVTAADLMTLAENGSGEGDATESAIPESRECICQERCGERWADVTCPVCRENPGACRGTVAQLRAADAGEEKESAGEAGGNNSSTVVFIFLAIAAAGGAGYYLKIYKPRHDLDDAEDLDELLADSDGQEVNEDGDEAGQGEG